MTTSADKPGSPPRSRLQFWLTLVAGLVLWINAFERPLVPSANLDPSWQTVLSFAHLEGLQFGKELIFTAGPWGWLGTMFMMPGAVVAKLVWSFLGRGLMVTALVAFGLRIPARQRWMFFAGILLFSAFFPDTLPFIVVVVSVLTWVFPGESRAWQTVLAIVGLALLAHFKFTYTLLIFAGIGAAGVSCIWEKSWSRAAAVLGGFAAAYVALWLAAGQPLVRLIGYWRHSIEISRGYAPAMAQDETLGVFVVGLLTLLATGLFLVGCLRTRKPRSLLWPEVGFLAASVLLAWKHGFTRADGHVVGFFAFVLLLALTLPACFHPERKWHIFEGTLLLCVIGTGLAMPTWLARTLTYAVHRVANNATAIATVASLPERYEAEFAARGRELGLPEVREITGDASIDLIGYEQARLLLGEFNYRPRPVFQSYSAYTPLLMARNLRFLQSARAPQYVAVKIQSINNRHPMGDDALALMELARRYESAGQFSDLLLMQMREQPPEAPDFRREMQLVTNVSLSETIPLPAHEGHAQWVQLVGYPTMLGKLRSAFLRPPILHMVVSDESGRETRHRVVLPAAAEGFLLNPHVQNTADFAGFVAGRAAREVRSIRFEPARPDQAEFWKGVGVRISSLPDFPVHYAGIEELIVSNGISNRKPVRIEAKFPPRIIRGSLWPELQVHAPGEMTFEAQGASAVSGNFRIAEGAYTGKGRTDGAEFVIEVTKADGSSEVIFYRHLQPGQNEADRGMQDFLVELPPDTVSVSLVTLPGPADNTNWDWTQWSKIRFSEGR